MKFPAKPTDAWSLADVREHLTFAVNLEMWTIPYYMTAMYSIKEVSDPTFRLLQSIVYQEMLHAELAANVYNAFQPTAPIELGPFVYTKATGVPHLDFDQDPQALLKYGEPDGAVGPLDLTRIGTMCLIELPETKPPPTNPEVTQYATIGDFYSALRIGMRQNADAIVGGRKQVNVFANFYNNFIQSTIDADGQDGLEQAIVLIDAITEQGEGRALHSRDDRYVDTLEIPSEFQNTADDYNPSWSHFLKFNAIRDGLLSDHGPAVYEVDPTAQGARCLEVLANNFRTLLAQIEQLFNGGNPTKMGAVMPTVGANILTCWRNGVVPQYPPTSNK